MCWKYENHYSDCFDLIFKGVFYTDDGLNAFLSQWGVRILDEEKFKTLFFDFLSKCHEEKIIDGYESGNRLETWNEELERNKREANE